MERKALILAGAVAFDLGVMAVAAQAQQTMDPPPVHTTTIPPEGRLDLLRVPPTGSSPTNSPSPGPAGGAAMGQAPAGTRPGDCVLRPTSPTPGGSTGPCGPAAISDQAAAGNLSHNLPSASVDGKHYPTIHIRIDRVNTIQACTERGGEVVPHQGAQHCRIPQSAAEPVVGEPAGIPPRNPRDRRRPVFNDR